MQNEINNSLMNYNTYDESAWVHTPVTITLLMMESLLYLVSNFGSILFATLLITKRVFNRNLAILLGNTIFTHVLLSISRYYNIVQTIAVYFVVEVKKLDNILVCWVINTFYNFSMLAGAMNQIFIVFERTIATVFAKTYEKSQRAFIGIFGLLTQVFAAYYLFLVPISTSEIRYNFMG